MNAFEADWSGTFNQPGFGEYPIRLEFKNHSLEVSYPSLGCGGLLHLQRIEGGVAYLREEIFYGRSTCLDGL